MDKRMSNFLINLNYRFKGKANRVTLKQMKLYLVCNDLHTENLLNGVRNQRAYEYYQFFCRIYGYKPVSLIEFSRFVCRWFPYQVTDRSVKVFSGERFEHWEWQKHRYFERIHNIYFDGPSSLNQS